VGLLAPPPAEGSAEEAADLATVRRVVAARTPAEEAQALQDADLSLSLFEPVIGPFFKPEQLPKMEALFKKVKKDIDGPIETAKDYFKRRRPYDIDQSLLKGPPEKDRSYPSGHSTRGMVEALLLAELFPQHKEAILEIGRRLGWDRVLLGKHFPTDVYAGRVVAQALVRELQASAAFQRDFAEVLSEVEAAQHQTSAK
jgi:acid phosphatase (class A)